MTEIAGKNALVTGGASGIGRRMALALAARGARPIIWDIHKPNLDRVVAEIKQETGIEALGYVCDISRRRQVYQVADRVRARVGAVDVLVNNAGVVTGKSFFDLPDEMIEKTFQVNAMALFWTAKAFVPDMIQRNCGHVVTVASAAGTIGVAKLADYSASKFAAFGFDESLRVELKKVAPGVKTTIVCPYFIDTGMFEGVRTRFPSLLPILREDKVAERIVKAIMKDQPRLIMPPMVYLVPLLRGLPVKAFDWTATFFGINASMDDFKGREPEE